MTTLTMIFGMLPIALSNSAGAEWKSGLAWALIGGLTSSMVLTLVVVPVVYLTFSTMRDWVSGKLHRRKPVRQSPESDEIDVDGQLEPARA